MRFVDRLRHAFRREPPPAVFADDQCHVCGGTLSLIKMHHEFRSLMPSGVSERLSCAIPVWCCDDCGSSFHDHKAADAISAKIREAAHDGF